MQEQHSSFSCTYFNGPQTASRSPSGSSKAENPHEATLTLHQWAQSALREQLMKACLFALSQNPPVRSHYIFQTQIQLKKIIYTMLLKSVINVRKVISCSAAEC